MQANQADFAIHTMARVLGVFSSGYHDWLRRYDNALAETINGLYKAEVIHRRAPWKTKDAVELASLEWVNWFNEQRLMAALDYEPPAEFDANYYRNLEQQISPV